MNYEVLLYYKFHRIEDPQAFRDEHHAKCIALGLKGRVYIANEGLNGTVAGTEAETQSYREYLGTKPGFENIAFKSETVEKLPFEKMKTKVRLRILNMGFKPEDDVDPSQTTGKHLSPKEWRSVLESQEDYVLLDIRNNYESAVGHFENAVCPDLESFTEFPEWTETLEKYRDKKLLMYCTGGIRCEKFSSLLVQKGFKDVNQLEGGILNYAKEEGGAHFNGRCFVFDDRLVIDVSAKPEAISVCHHCGTSEDRYVNCSNMECNRLFIICDACAEKHEATCSAGCYISKVKRPFHKTDFRVPFRKKGVVFPELGRKH